MRLDNIKSKVKKELSFTQEQWKEAIADYEFEKATVEVDEETTESLIEMCRAIASRDSNKSPFDVREFTDLKFQMQVIDRAMVTHRAEFEKIQKFERYCYFVATNLKTLTERSFALEGQVKELQDVLKEKDDRISGLESQLQEVRAQVQEFRNTSPVVKEEPVVKAEHPKTADAFADFDSMFS